MGHDITAYNPTIDRHQKYEEIRQLPDGDDKRERYEKLYDEIEVAYNRRNYADPNNRLLYEVLDVTKVYAGVSGDGSSVMINMAQLQIAKMRLAKLAHDPETDRERDFVNRCIAFLEREDLDQLEVRFS